MAQDLMGGMNLAAWIGMVSDGIVAITAVVTARLAYREYLKPLSQAAEAVEESRTGPQPATEFETVEAPDDELVLESAAARPADDTLSEAVVFDTSQQQTTLKVTQRGLECHLLDKQKNRSGHQWSIGAAAARKILETHNYSVNPGARANSGRFNIGGRTNWLYSKKLFPDPEYLRGTLAELLRGAVQRSGS